MRPTAGGCADGCNSSEHLDMSEDKLTLDTTEQRRVLLIVLALNVLLFAALALAGWIADSSALIANALDNLSDSAVYAISLFAVGRGDHWKRRAARASGILLLMFAALVVADALRRVLTGGEPLGLTMMAMAGVAAAVNLICLRLLRPLRRQDVNMRAAQTFSANDFIANAGIVIAGALVLWTGMRWLDLAVGLVVAVVAAKGGGHLE